MPPRKRKEPETTAAEGEGVTGDPSPKRSKGAATKEETPKKGGKVATPKEEKAKGKAEGEEGGGEGEEGAEKGSTLNKTMPTSYSYPPLSPGRFKITTYNLDGFNSAHKNGSTKYLEADEADVVCLQETKLNPDGLPKDLSAKYPHVYWSCCTAKKGYAGTALLAKEKPLNVTFGIGKKEHDEEGRTITAEFPLFFLVNTYVPNSGQKLERLGYRATWDQDLQAYLKSLDQKKPVIWTGDLNVAHQEIDLSNPKTNKKTAGFTQQERDSFGKFLNEGFVDSYRHLYPDLPGQYTFWGKRFDCRGKDIGWRLDYFVISKRFMEKVADVYARKEVWGASDHVPLCLELKDLQ